VTAPKPPERGDDEPKTLDDGAMLIDALLGFSAALSATGSTELPTLTEFLR